MRGVAVIVACTVFASLDCPVQTGEDNSPSPLPPHHPRPAQLRQRLRQPKLDPGVSHAGSNTGGRRCRQGSDQGELLDGCPVTAGEAGEFALTGLAMSLFAAVLPKAIDKGVELAANYARQKGSDQETLADPSIVWSEGLLRSSRRDARLAISGECVVVGVGPVRNPVAENFWSAMEALGGKLRESPSLGSSFIAHLSC